MTELVFILDRSGSMAGLESDTIGGFNAMLEKQRRQEGHVLVSTVLFDSASYVLHDRVPLDRVEPMTRNDYCAGGCTALLDAVGSAIHHIETVHRYIRPADRPERTLFVITTDGLENASHRYNYDQVKAMVRRQQDLCGWEFLFLGANIDAAAEARRFGISPDRAAEYCSDKRGTALNYDVIGDAVSRVRRCQPLAPNWKERINEDRRKRGW
jgi:uncharacterized protein YegL